MQSEDFLMDNRINIMNYWNGEEIVLAFSRRDPGLIGIGIPLISGGERWIHLNRKDIEKILLLEERYRREEGS